jgi:NADPH:quinone reductase-like Zn-dependent oxidoreductase
VDHPGLLPDRVHPERRPADGVRGESSDLPAEAIQRYVGLVEQGRLPLRIDRVFAFDEVAEAHRIMEEGRAVGKLVVRVN